MSSVVCVTVSGCNQREHLSLEDLVSCDDSFTENTGVNRAALNIYFDTPWI